MSDYPEDNYLNALNMGNILLRKRLMGILWHPAISFEDEQQEWAAHLAFALPKYDPAKGKLSTWTYRVFDLWAINRYHARKKVWDHERAVDPSPGRESGGEGTDKKDSLLESLEWPWSQEPTPEWSEAAEGFIAALPERIRDSIRLHWGEGLSSSATAERLGISARTVERHTATARRLIETNQVQHALAA